MPDIKDNKQQDVDIMDKKFDSAEDVMDFIKKELYGDLNPDFYRSLISKFSGKIADIAYMKRLTITNFLNTISSKTGKNIQKEFEEFIEANPNVIQRSDILSLYRLYSQIYRRIPEIYQSIQIYIDNILSPDNDTKKSIFIKPPIRTSITDPLLAEAQNMIESIFEVTGFEDFLPLIVKSVCVKGNAFLEIVNARAYLKSMKILTDSISGTVMLSEDRQTIAEINKRLLAKRLNDIDSLYKEKILTESAKQKIQNKIYEFSQTPILEFSNFAVITKSDTTSKDLTFDVKAYYYEPPNKIINNAVKTKVKTQLKTLFENLEYAVAKETSSLEISGVKLKISKDKSKFEPIGLSIDVSKNRLSYLSESEFLSNVNKNKIKFLYESVSKNPNMKLMLLKKLKKVLLEDDNSFLDTLISSATNSILNEVDLSSKIDTIDLLFEMQMAISNNFAILNESNGNTRQIMTFLSESEFVDVLLESINKNDNSKTKLAANQIIPFISINGKSLYETLSEILQESYSEIVNDFMQLEFIDRRKQMQESDMKAKIELYKRELHEKQFDKYRRRIEEKLKVLHEDSFFDLSLSTGGARPTQDRPANPDKSATPKEKESFFSLSEPITNDNIKNKEINKQQDTKQTDTDLDKDSYFTMAYDILKSKSSEDKDKEDKEKSSEDLDKEKRHEKEVSALSKMFSGKTKESLSDVFLIYHHPEEVIIVHDKTFVYGYLIIQGTNVSSLGPQTNTPQFGVSAVPSLSGIAKSTSNMGSFFAEKIISLLKGSIGKLDKALEENPGLVKILERIIATKEISSLKIRYIPVDFMEHFKIKSSETFPYGESLLYPITDNAKFVIAAEAAVLLYRLTRAQDRYIYKVDIGTDRTRVAEILQELKREMNQKLYAVNEAGDIDSLISAVSQFDDIYSIMEDGRDLLTVDVINGGDFNSKIEDLEYFKNKNLVTLGVPSIYLKPETEEAKYTLSQENTRFARTIIRIQKDLAESIKNLVLKILNIVDDTLIPIISRFTIGLKPPVALQMERLSEIYGNISNVVEALKNMGVPKDAIFREFVPIDWVYTEQFDKLFEKIKNITAPKQQENNEESM